MWCSKDIMLQVFGLVMDFINYGEKNIKLAWKMQTCYASVMPAYQP